MMSWGKNLFKIVFLNGKGGTHPYMQKTSDVAGLAFLAKKNWRKIWPKNGLKWPKMA